VAYSKDDGQTWQQLKLNLPTVPVHDLVVKNTDLVLATHGRSIWILDDLTPIRTMATDILAKDVHLFEPSETTRFRVGRGPRGAGYSGENPPQGAQIHYYLKSKPKSPVNIEILDAQGAVVSKLSSKPEADAATDEEMEGRFGFRRTLLTTEPGVNRVAWNLSYAGPTSIKGAASWPGAPPVGPMVNPGSYTIQLKADGQTVTTTLVVKQDPRVHVPPSDLDEQLKLALSTRDKITHLSQMVKQIRAVKQQITSRNELLKENPKAELLVKLGQEFIGKLDALEGKLHNPKAEISYDLLALRGGAKLYSHLCTLLGSIMGSDGAPTQGMRDSYAENDRELQQLETELNGLLTGDLAKLNEMADSLGIKSVIVPSATENAVKK
jgi:hypothetical protein